MPSQTDLPDTLARYESAWRKPWGAVLVQKSEIRHRMAAGSLVLAKSILGGLHHEYSLVTARAGA